MDAYIDKIMIVLVIAFAAIFGYMIGKKRTYAIIGNEMYKQRKKINSLNFLYEVCSRWMLTIESGVKVSDFFYKNSIETVAIYGMGKIGKTLEKHLRENGVNIKYGIDIHKEKIKSDIPIYNLEDDLPRVSMIVVTVWSLDVVRRDLTGKSDAKIVSIEDILKVILEE